MPSGWNVTEKTSIVYVRKELYVSICTKKVNSSIEYLGETYDINNLCG